MQTGSSRSQHRLRGVLVASEIALSLMLIATCGLLPLEIFGGSALVLCMAGLYGLLAYVVSQRTRELGVRIALGASRGNLLWMVIRQAGSCCSLESRWAWVLRWFRENW